MIGVLLSLGLLMYLAYRGISVMILAPLLAMLAVLLSEGGPLLASYTQIFMPALGDFIIRFFPLFLLGAIFGRVMRDGGAADVIARAVGTALGPQNAALAVVLACAALTYGGVSLFVVAFAIYPIAASLFVAADRPKRMIPAAIALGAFTFTMSALPGTPQIQNTIPIPYFGTDSFAAPLHGLLASAVMLAFGMWWINRRLAAAEADGEGYGEQDAYSAPADMQVDRGESDREVKPDPPLWAAATPIALVIVVNLVLSRAVFPLLDADYLAEPQYGGASLDAVRGLWSLIVALTAAILAGLALFRERIEDVNGTVAGGVTASFSPIFNTASQVGYGAVIAALPAFAAVRDAVVNLAPGAPLASAAVAINLLAGITGSASGGMTIALEALGATYLEMAAAADVSPALLHRVAALSSGVFDVLPHSGAVITLFAITGLTHQKSYGDVFVVAVAGPLLGLLAALALSAVF